MKEELDAITVLRLIMAIGVMMAHANLFIDKALFQGMFVPGWSGVDFFFVLSGFLICHIYSDNTTRASIFLKKRFIRIYPTYWLFTICTVVAHLVATKLGGVLVTWIPVDLKSVILSLVTYPLDVPIIATGWTLPYEIIFYIVALMYVTGRKRLFTGVSFGWMAMIAIGTVTGEHHRLINFITSPLFIEFYFGILVAVLIGKAGKHYAAEAFVIGMGWLMASWIGTCFSVSWIVEIHRVLRFGVPYALILYGLVCLEISGKIKMKYFRGIVKGFSASTYSLYLIHYPLICAIITLMPIPTITKFLFTVLICIFAGYIGYRCLERPLTQAMHVMLEGGLFKKEKKR